MINTRTQIEFGEVASNLVYYQELLQKRELLLAADPSSLRIIRCRSLDPFLFSRISSLPGYSLLAEPIHSCIPSSSSVSYSLFDIAFLRFRRPVRNNRQRFRHPVITNRHKQHVTIPIFQEKYFN